jgi:hypothetical protein
VRRDAFVSASIGPTSRRCLSSTERVPGYREEVGALIAGARGCSDRPFGSPCGLARGLTAGFQMRQLPAPNTVQQAGQTYGGPSVRSVVVLESARI